MAVARITSARRAGRTAAARLASKPAQFGQGDCQLGAEMPYDEAVLAAKVYAQKLRDLDLTHVYGIRIERLRFDQACVLMGRHDDRPMPARAII